MSLLRGFLVAAMCCLEGGLAQGTDNLSPARLDGFRRELSTLLSRHEIPGIGVALVTTERVAWSGGVGVADHETQRRITEGTVFPMGSISKSLVGLSAMMLVEEAKLDLASPVIELAPGFEFENPWAGTHPLRMVHLMEHTTGWDDLTLREDAYDAPRSTSLGEALALEPRSRVSRWPPGRSMSYCDSGPAAAAYVIEQLCGQSYDEFVRNRILDPLQMSLSGFEIGGEIEERLARGYHAGRPVPRMNHLFRPSRGLLATPKEMANYVRMFLGEGERDGVRLVKPESVDRMMESRTPRAVKAGADSSYGLGLSRHADQGQIWYGHSGGLAGFRSDFAWCPRLGIGYAFMMNSSSAGFHEVRRAFRRFITIGHRPVDMPAVARVDPAVLDSYQGYYQLDTPSREQERFLVPLFGMVRIDQTEAALLLTRIRIMRGATAEQLVPVSERVFRSPESPLATVVFLEGDDEGTASLAGSDYVRVPDGLVWSRWILAGGILALMASSLLGALIWLPRMLFSQTFRARGGAGVRIVPALSTMSFLAACAFLQGGLADEVERLGEASVWSGGFLVTSLLFAVTAMAGFGLALRARGLGMVPRVHVLLVTSAQVATALYLAWWEMIGLQTWT